MDYPVWDVAIGGGVLMAIVAITHVIVAHFAIGGGLLIAVTETLAVRRGDGELRELARRSSLVLILVSTVFGAISGVGIWVVAGLISPAAISALIHIYVWGWAIEWTFFLVEIIAALVYYATWGRISHGAHLAVIWIYVVSAYLSMVVINGIITFMLTPGDWLATGAFWDGFLNPSYWPSLALRTGIAVLMAAVFMLLVAQRASASERPRLVRYLGWWLAGAILVSYAGYRWWEAVLPETVTRLFRGAEPLLATLAGTRSLMMWALAAALGLSVIAVLTAPKAGRTLVVVVIALAAFTFFGAYERLREGARKPFLIHSFMFANGLRVSDIGRIGTDGMRAASPWLVPQDGEAGVEVGRAIFLAQCASCHTRDGYQGIRPLLPTLGDALAVAADDPAGAGTRAFDRECARCHPDLTFDEARHALPAAQDIRDDPGMIHDLNLGMIEATLDRLRAMGETYTSATPGRMVDTHVTSSPYMPPLVGIDTDLEALAAYLASLDGHSSPPRQARMGGER